MGRRSTDSILAVPETEVTLKELGHEKDTSRIRALLLEAHSLRGAEARLKVIKTELGPLLFGSEGIREGNKACLVRWQNGREVLKPEKLVEQGVTPEQIQAATVQSNGFYVVEFPSLDD